MIFTGEDMMYVVSSRESMGSSILIKRLEMIDGVMSMLFRMKLHHADYYKVDMLVYVQYIAKLLKNQ